MPIQTRTKLGIALEERFKLKVHRQSEAVPVYTLLSRILNRVVIDKTGEPGLFDLHFEFTPNDATPLGGPPPPVSAAGENDISIFTALEQQLGLKLESAKGPVEVLRIDSVQKPSEN